MPYSPRAERLQCVSVSGFHSCERRESRAAARSQAGAALSWTSERADRSFVCEASEEGSGPKAPTSASGASNVHGVSGAFFPLRVTTTAADSQRDARAAQNTPD